MTRRYFLALVPLSALFLTGCPKSEDTAPPMALAGKTAPDTGAFKDLDPWILKTTNPNANRGNHGIYLGNGAQGATFGANGAAEKDSVAFVARGYDER